MINRNIIFSVVIAGLTYVNSFGQTPRKSPPPVPSPKVTMTTNVTSDNEQQPQQAATPADLATILSEAAKQVDNYVLAFKDLLATETKTFTRYGKDGDSKGQTTVESEFLVYQSPKDQNVTSELRNVLKVDGKLVPDSQSRSERFQAELQKTTTVESELEKIQKEGARYDKTLEASGLTLFEGGVLDEKLQPSFDFQLVGSENVDGGDAYVISYQQTKKSPYITLNTGRPDEDKGYGYEFNFEVPGTLKNSDYFLRGKLWIDKQTYQVRRELRELTVQADTPLVLFANDFNYQASDYGILVPKQISVTINALKRDKSTGNYQPVKDTNVSYDYSKFRKINTDVKILDDTN